MRFLMYSIFHMKGGIYINNLEDRIKIVKDEVVNLSVDAIINPTDEHFSGKYGLDKLIQKKAGEKLCKKLSKIGSCDIGQCTITKGYDLNVKSIIHTSTPKYDNGDEDEIELLYSCYKNSIELAIENDNKTIGIPSISSGNNKFPIDKSANIAYYAAWKMLKKYSLKELEIIYFSCTNKSTYDIYKQLSQDYKDIEYSIEMLEEYRKGDKYSRYELTIEDFINNMGVENAYCIFLLKEAFLSGDIELKYIEESVKVLKNIFLHMKNMTKIFSDKIYTEELDRVNDILKEVFNTFSYDTIDRAEEKTRQYFIHPSDYIFEKINNSFRY